MAIKTTSLTARYTIYFEQDGFECEGTKKIDASEAVAMIEQYQAQPETYNVWIEKVGRTINSALVAQIVPGKQPKSVAKFLFT